MPRFIRSAAAAAILFVATVSGLAIWQSRHVTVVRTGWDVVRLTGTPRVGSQAIVTSSRATGLAVGETLETDSESRATISANGVGELNVEPNTRLRVLRTGPGRERLALDRGKIHATIWAPPGDFVVDTPSARAIDLGCVYTLQVDDSGAGLLRTQMGWVGFKLADRESLIPAGAICATHPKSGPGTPYFEAAPESLRAALSAFDFEETTAEKRTAQSDLILKHARKQDALTLWHLLARVNTAQRERVYERLATLVPPPQTVTREGILRLDQAMIDSWWTELGYGDVSLWRTFERAWSQTEPQSQ